MKEAEKQILWQKGFLKDEKEMSRKILKSSNDQLMAMELNFMNEKAKRSPNLRVSALI